MIIQENWSTEHRLVASVCEYDCAQSIIDELVNIRQRDKIKLLNRKQYVILEFPPDVSFGNPDFLLNSNTGHLSIAAEHIDRVIRETERKGGFNNYLFLICEAAKKLGVPDIMYAHRSPIGKIKTRSIQEVRCALSKVEKKHNREMKELREINDRASENLNPETTAAIEVLRWLYNDGAGREPSSIMDTLFDFKQQMERARMFHTRRHSAKELDGCFSPEIEEKTKWLEWVIINNETSITTARDVKRLRDLRPETFILRKANQ